MIELNLLPEELKKKRKTIELPEIPIVPIVVFIVIIMVTIQLLLGGLNVILNKQYAALDKTWQGLKPKKTELDRVKKKISSVTKKTQVIEELMMKRVSWAEILNELSNSITQNTWLTSLGYSERIDRRKVKGPERGTVEVKVGTLQLSGYAAGQGGQATEFITHFVKSLRNNDNFSKYFVEIQHGPIKKASVADQEVMSFTINCEFSPEERGI